MKMSKEKQWSTIVPNTSTDCRGDIRRNGNPLRHPELGFQGCQTLYEAFRRGQALNPLGTCLGFRAVSTTGMATPYIYSSYTEVLARVNAFAAGLDTLNLVCPTQDNMTLVGDQMTVYLQVPVALAKITHKCLDRFDQHSFSFILCSKDCLVHEELYGVVHCGTGNLLP